MRKTFLSIILLIVSLTLLGCGKKKEAKDGVTIYSLNPEGQGLVKRTYSFNSNLQDTRISELLNALTETQTGKYRAVFSQSDYIGTFENQYGTLKLRLNADVFKESDSMRMLRFAALVRSLFSIEDIHEVQLLIGEKEDATVLSYTKDSFFDTIEPSLVYQKSYFYFSDLTRYGLYEFEMMLPMETIDKHAYQIVEALIKGPEVGYCLQTVPPQTKIRSVVVERNVCYVDLNEEFLDYLNEMPAYLTLYSIVNSLTKLDYIQEVVFLVNGSSNVTYRDLDLQTHFSFNRVIVNGSEE